MSRLTTLQHQQSHVLLRLLYVLFTVYRVTLQKISPVLLIPSSVVSFAPSSRQYNNTHREALPLNSVEQRVDFAHLKPRKNDVIRDGFTSGFASKPYADPLVSAMQDTPDTDVVQDQLIATLNMQDNPETDAVHDKLIITPNMQGNPETDVVHDQLIPSNQHTNDTDIDHDPSFHSEFELQSMTEDALSCSELRVLGSSSDTDILLDQSSSKPVIESEPSPITHSSAVSDSSNLTNHNLIASSLLSTPDHSSSQSSHLRPSIGAVIALSSMCSVAILSSIALYTMSIWIASQHRIRGVPHDPLPVEII
uniref:Uncharacterized protein n=1 Tax=Spongospora subterranea TaxID=70186 RepID=A0A0H5R5M7_9EUKA|eukprot:CRZ03494.1 hypothetical protein [Spongospora subterranea]